MKKIKAGELLWMSVPVFLLGGLAWWFGSGGKTPGLRLSNPFDPGALRVEYTPFEKVELSPFDVSQGFNWAVKTRPEVVGTCDIAPNWNRIYSESHLEVVRLAFKRGTKWESLVLGVPLLYGNRKKSWLQQTTGYNDETTFKVDLSVVPHDASEVRLRGAFSGSQLYRGTIPPTWKPPKNWHILGGGQEVIFSSKPFDIQIKGPNEPFPVPVVSRKSPLQVIDAKWIVESGENNFVLQVRRTDGQKWKSDWIAGQNLRVFDEKGQRLFWGRNNSSISAALNQQQFSSRRASTDLMIPFIWPDGAHDQAYEVKAKGPLRLQVQISDGTCWPLLIDVRVPRVEMKLSDFGAPK